MIRQKYTALIVLIPALLLASCGSKHLVNKTFTGQPVSFIKGKLGQPTHAATSEGDSLYIFERMEKLKSTEISQGKTTLDPIYTPEVTKKEQFFFTVRNGVVVKTVYKEEYER